jgi:hypothetical protein
VARSAVVASTSSRETPFGRLAVVLDEFPIVLAVDDKWVDGGG